MMMGMNKYSHMMSLWGYKVFIDNMNIRRIIEQEVDKQEWGLELPNKVKLGNKTLELTDRGLYQGDNTEVEYKVEDDKVLTIDGKELKPIQESDFDWTSDIGDSTEIAMMNSFSIYIPNGFDQMEKLSKILMQHFPENGGGPTQEDWPDIRDLMNITKNGTEPIWIEVDKEISPENTWTKTWKAMPGRETIHGSMNNSGEPRSTIIQAKDVVNNFESLNESNDFDWADDISTTIETESDIPQFINREMYNVDVTTGEPMSADEGRVVELIYWIELNGEEPEAYNVCWDEYVDNGEQKVCTRFRASSIVKMFNDGEFIFI